MRASGPSRCPPTLKKDMPTHREPGSDQLLDGAPDGRDMACDRLRRGRALEAQGWTEVDVVLDRQREHDRRRERRDRGADEALEPARVREQRRLLLGA